MVTPSEAACPSSRLPRESMVARATHAFTGTVAPLVSNSCVVIGSYLHLFASLDFTRCTLVGSPLRWRSPRLARHPGCPISCRRHRCPLRRPFHLAAERGGFRPVADGDNVA